MQWGTEKYFKFHTLGPVVQRWISVNPGLKYVHLFQNVRKENFY
jgi:hypothetical protein